MSRIVSVIRCHVISFQVPSHREISEIVIVIIIKITAEYLYDARLVFIGETRENARDVKTIVITLAKTYDYVRRNLLVPSIVIDMTKIRSCAAVVGESKRIQGEHTRWSRP